VDLSKLSTPLRTDQIEFRVQSINKGGYATLLVYKDARADMQRLDEVCGPLGWQRRHCRENHNCVVSIWDEKSKQWISKEDTGTESNAEAQKGLASDSFKRACFNWGIGRELYAYPLISLKLQPKEVDLTGNKPKTTWEFKLKEWGWYSEFDDQGNISFLAATDHVTKNPRFTWGTMKAKGE